MRRLSLFAGPALAFALAITAGPAHAQQSVLRLGKATSAEATSASDHAVGSSIDDVEESPAAYPVASSPSDAIHIDSNWGAGDVFEDDGCRCQSCACEACGCAPFFFGPRPDRAYLAPAFGRLQTSGWLNGGFMGNVNNPTSRFNGPYNAIDRSNETTLNQAYLVAESALPDDGSLGLGFRADLLYGADFLLAQSIGMERTRTGANRWNQSQFYGLALPQAYVQLGSATANIKAGHFYTPIGYEGVPAPNNFFYSKSYSYQFAGPFTHWGVLGQSSPTDRLQLTLGLTNGWDALDRVANRLGILAGAKATSDYGFTSFAITTGHDPTNLAGLPGVPTGSTNRTRYSLIQAVDLGERSQYVFHHWLGTQAKGSPDGGSALWAGIDQYLYYSISDRARAALRFEWFRDNDGTRVGLNRPGNPNKPPLEGSFYSISGGINLTPRSNLIFRPEMRYDWFGGTPATLPFDDGNRRRQMTLGTDAIWLF